MSRPDPLRALIAQWRKEADELDEAAHGTWIEPDAKRACADELEACLAGSVDAGETPASISRLSTSSDSGQKSAPGDVRDGWQDIEGKK